MLEGRIVVVVCGALALAGCHRWPRDARGFAAAFVERAQTGSLPEGTLDADLADRARRVQLLKRVPSGRVSPATLAALWRDSASPLPAAARAEQLRTHAIGAVRAATSGHCRADVDAELGATRMELLTGPVPGAPAEAAAELRQLAAVLGGAAVLRVRCDRGEVGLVAVPRPSSPWWAVVDLFDAGGGGPAVQIVR